MQRDARFISRNGTVPPWHCAAVSMHAEHIRSDLDLDLKISGRSMECVFANPIERYSFWWSFYLSTM